MLWAISRVAAPNFAEKAGMIASVTITRMNKGQFNPQAAEGA